MAVIINNFEILNDNSELAISLETSAGQTITSVLLWKMDDFKDYSLAIDLSSNLEQINNLEVFIVTAASLNLSSFEDILFIEVEGTVDEEDEGCSDCQDPALGITYSLNPFYTCLLDYFLEDGLIDCGSCTSDNEDIIFTINILIDMTVKALEVGYYTQAIDMVNKLKKLCAAKRCNNCEPVSCTSCSTFIC
jgi:hypothetical protein